jgi:aldose 1-epimerase
MLTLEAGAARLVLAPEVGGSVYEWRRGGLPMFRAADPAGVPARDARKLGSYPLVPFSNRIAGRRFSWAGKTYDLPEQFGGFAIHGVGWLREWAVTAQDAASATIALAQGPCAEWPFAFRAWQRFELSADGLVSVIGVENADRVAFPAGIGQHPYFPRSPGSRLTFRAGSVWQNSEVGRIPTVRTAVPAEWDYSGGAPVGSFVDNCFAGWDGRAVLEYPDLGYRLTISAGAPFGHTVVFMPVGQDFYAVEPVSHMNDAINRMEVEADHGLVVLQPGERLEGRIEYAVSAL